MREWKSGLTSQTPPDPWNCRICLSCTRADVSCTVMSRNKLCLNIFPPRNVRQRRAKYVTGNPSLKPGLHISRKDRKHMVANMYFKLYRYDLVLILEMITICDISQETYSINILTALKSSLKHRRKHVLWSFRLYGTWSPYSRKDRKHVLATMSQGAYYSCPGGDYKNLLCERLLFIIKNMRYHVKKTASQSLLLSSLRVWPMDSCLSSPALSQVYLSLTFQLSQTAVIKVKMSSTFLTVPVKLNNSKL